MSDYAKSIIGQTVECPESITDSGRLYVGGCEPKLDGIHRTRGDYVLTVQAIEDGRRVGGSFKIGSDEIGGIVE